MTAQELSPTDPAVGSRRSLDYRFDIVGRSRLWFSLSLAVLLVGLVSMAFSLASLGTPLRLGLDFAGGTLLDLRFEQPVTTDELRRALQEHDLGTSIIQLDTQTGQEALIRMPPLTEQERLAVEATLRQQIGPFERKLVETVGPTVGRLLLRSGLVAVLISFGLIVVYLALRFQWDYAVFAIVALLHDVVLTTGLFALLGLTVRFSMTRMGTGSAPALSFTARSVAVSTVKLPVITAVPPVMPVRANSGPTIGALISTSSRKMPIGRPVPANSRVS